MPKTAAPDPTVVPVEILNLDGINQLALLLRHGMNELWGPNASMKTRARAAIEETVGSQRHLTVGVSDARRDGTDALLGSATVAGRTLTISRTGAVSRSGEMLADLSLADTSPVSRLIDPGIKDPSAKQREQLKALLELVPLPVTEDRLLKVAAGDEETLTFLAAAIEEREVGDMLAAVKIMRSWVQAQAREREEAVERAERRLGQSRGALEERLEEATRALSASGTPASKTKVLEAFAAAKPVGDVARAKAMADESLGRIRSERQACLDKKRERAELQATVGEEPDLEPVRVELTEATDAHLAAVTASNDAARTVERLRRELATAETAAEVAEADRETKIHHFRRAERRLEERQGALARWTETMAKLREEPTGPSEEEVDRAEAAAQAAERKLTVARIAERYAELQTAIKETTEERTHAEVRAEALRGIEKGAWAALGELVTAETRVPEITIYNGFLAYVGQDKVPLDWNSKYVSTGQRNSAAFRLGARCFGPHSIIQLDGAIWETLEIEEMMQLHRVCREERIFGLTEVASARIDELHHVLVGSPEWVEAYRMLAEAAQKASEAA